MISTFVGKRFAGLAAKTAMSSVLREFKIECSQKTESLRLIPMTILEPCGGINVKLIPRKHTT